MESLIQDARLAFRSLSRTPGFTITAIITLGLGIGANTAVFSLTHSTVFRPLPFREPERLVLVHESRADARTPSYASMPNFADWREQNRVFEAMAAYTDLTFNLTGPGEPERLDAIQMSASLLPLIGAEPELGRNFLAEEDRLGARPSVILSYDLWRRRLQEDPAVIGGSVTLNDRPYTIVGVMPRGFQFPIQASRVDVWTPIEIDEFPQMRLRDGRLVRVIARLKPDVTVAQAQREMSVIAARLEAEYRQTNEKWGVQVERAHDHVVGGSRATLLTLSGAVGFVLLIACANLANLFLARVTSRANELSLRVALGAGRSRLVRHVLMEVLVLSAAGGVAGTLAFAALRSSLLALAPPTIPRVGEASLDGATLTFAAAATVTTALLVSLAPAALAWRARTFAILRQERIARRTRMRRWLVAVEVAVALVLLTGAALLVQSLVRLVDVDPGFDPHRVDSVALELSERTYPMPAQRAAFFSELTDRVRGLPGVESAAVAFPLPFESPVVFPFTIEGRPNTGPRLGAYYRAVSADYFVTLRIPLLRGRTFNERDRAGVTPVVVVNQSMAARLWPGEDPIGHRIAVVDRNNGDLTTSREIVGIVGDVKHIGLDRPSGPEMCVPFAQAPSLWMSLLIRRRDAPVSSSTIASEIHRIDPNVPVLGIEPVEERVQASLASRRFAAGLLVAFASVALLLTGLGIWGITAYTVSRRTQEIGVRMALGAVPRDVVRATLAATSKVALAGAAIGLIAASGLTRFLAGLLFGVGPIDAPTFGIASLAVLAVALAAAYAPARRATRIDPVIALRQE